MAGPLQGIKILEVAEYIAVPSAMAICADWGADVVKVENPKGGDGMRGLQSFEGLHLKKNQYLV